MFGIQTEKQGWYSGCFQPINSFKQCRFIVVDKTKPNFQLTRLKVKLNVAFKEIVVMLQTFYHWIYLLSNFGWKYVNSLTNTITSKWWEHCDSKATNRKNGKLHQVLIKMTNYGQVVTNIRNDFCFAVCRLFSSLDQLVFVLQYWNMI